MRRALKTPDLPRLYLDLHKAWPSNQKMSMVWYQPVQPQDHLCHFKVRRELRRRRLCLAKTPELAYHKAKIFQLSPMYPLHNQILPLCFQRNIDHILIPVQMVFLRMPLLFKWLLHKQFTNSNSCSNKKV